MDFYTDKQTLDDLNILGKYTSNSVFTIFNAVVTKGGERLLDKLFHEPLNNPETINERSRLFRFFQKRKESFPIDKTAFQTAEQYINHTDYPNTLTAWINSLRIKILGYLGLDKEYRLMQEGLTATVKVLKSLRAFSENIENSETENLYSAKCAVIKSTLEDKRLSWLNHFTVDKKITFLHFAKYDHVLRFVLKDKIAALIDIIYDIDVNIAVANVAEKRGFGYASAQEKEPNHLLLEGLFHPAVKNAVDNNVLFTEDKNVIFLTGANMAGKSTLMKALGVALYLAHMGFPVPAKKMEFSVKDGMYTSINVPDNLNMGYSHFYAEVLRVKTVAEAVSSKKRLFIIFDELFKGTNVKDAYDATVAITDAFSKKPNSTFLISTHIMEAGETLKEKTDNIKFLFLPTDMDGVVPVYPYKLREGITDDRHGMIIINNEKIIEIINGEC